MCLNCIVFGGGPRLLPVVAVDGEKKKSQLADARIESAGHVSQTKGRKHRTSGASLGPFNAEYLAGSRAFSLFVCDVRRWFHQRIRQLGLIFLVVDSDDRK